MWHSQGLVIWRVHQIQMTLPWKPKCSDFQSSSSSASAGFEHQAKPYALGQGEQEVDRIRGVPQRITIAEIDLVSKHCAKCFPWIIRLTFIITL